MITGDELFRPTAVFRHDSSLMPSPSPNVLGAYKRGFRKITLPRGRATIALGPRIEEGEAKVAGRAGSLRTDVEHVENLACGGDELMISHQISSSTKGRVIDY